MRSPINWGLLGLLIRRPSHGYELWQRLKRTYPGTVEVSSPGQIYTALDTLRRRGLIKAAAEEALLLDVQRQRKLQYRATKAGIRAYEQWLVEQVNDGPRHSQMLAEHVAAVGPEHALAVLERCAEICLQEVEELPREETEQPDRLAERLAGEGRRLSADAMLTWIEYVRSELGAAGGERRP